MENNDERVNVQPEERQQDTKERKKDKYSLPFIALMLEAVSLFLIGFGALLVYTVLFMQIGLILWLVALCLPFASVALAIIAICRGVKRTGVKGMIMSVAAIALPVIAVTVTIILFSTGVAYIRLM